MGIKLGDAILYLTADDSPLGQKLSGAKKNVTGWATNLGGTVATLAGGAVVAGATAAAGAVVGIGAAAISTSSQIRASQRDMQAELGLTTEEAERLNQVAVNVFKTGIPGSIDESKAAIVETRRQLGDLGDKELEFAAEKSLKFADTFKDGQDDILNTVKVLREDLGLSTEQAFDFIAKGYQEGLNASGDFLDSVREYGNLFGENGASADEMFSVLQTGLKGGVLGTDKAGDLFKEFGIRIREAGEFTGNISQDFERVRAELLAIEDPVARNARGVELFGTMWEDLGESAVLGIDTTTTKLSDMSGATADVDQRFRGWGQFLKRFKNQALVAIAPLGDRLFELADKAMPYVEQAFGWLEKQLPPIIEEAGKWFDWLLQQVKIYLVPFIQDTLVPAFKEFGSWLMQEGIPNFVAFITPIINQVVPGLKLLGEIALNIASFVMPLLLQWWQFLGDHMNIVLPILGAVGLAILAITSPISIVIGLIVLLATAWANNWGGIQEKTQAVLDFIMPYIQAAMAFIQGIITTVMAYISDWWTKHGDNLMTVAKAVWDFILKVIDKNIKTAQAVIQAVLNWIKKFWDDWGQTILLMATLVWDNIKTVVKAAMDLIGFIIDAAAALIRGDWEAFGQAMQDIWRTVWETVKTILNNAKTALVAVIVNLISIIKGKWQAFVDRLSSTWSGLWDGLKQGVIDAKDAIVEKIEEIISTITDKFKGLDLYEAGKGILNSIIDGMKAGVGSIGDIAEDLVDKLISEIKESLGIASPSTVFQGIGLNSMLGLAKGLTDNMNLPMSAFRNIVANLSAEIGFGGSGGQTSVSSVINNYLNLTSTAPVGHLTGEFDSMAAGFGTP